MQPYISFFNITIPSYGFMIALGLIISNILMYNSTDKSHRNDFWTLEGYLLLGAFLGAKLLYLLTIFPSIQWSKITDLVYLNSLFTSGFVFLGGLLGAILCCFIAHQLHNIDAYTILSKILFGIPLVHGFGRIGCFLAGCCYGIPYNGIGAVIYPADSLGPAGESRFPVQLVETFLLWILALVVWVVSKKSKKLPFLIYLIGYSILRFLLEFLRADAIRGTVGIFSTSQFICILLVVVTTFYTIKNRQSLD